MNKNDRIDALVRDGWTCRFAKFYIDGHESEENSPSLDQEYVRWAHSKGFDAASAYAYGLNEENIKHYLSDAEYYKTWPLNCWAKIWVDDKLTLKYMLSNTKFDDFMPRYYYYSTKGGLRYLMDHPFADNSLDGFIKLLSEKREIAGKPCNGVMSGGFMKFEYQNGSFYINSKKVVKEDIVKFVSSTPNYVYTEYIHPSTQFKRFSDQIHTIRIVTLNENGCNPQIVGGYLRLPNRSTGAANFNVLSGNDTESYNLLVEMDFETGEFKNAKKIFVNRVESVKKHPDNCEVINGVVENYSELKNTVLEIAQRFNTLEWLGFDIGVTDKGFKCMEINTHPGIKYMQVFHPIKDDEVLKKYFAKRIKEIDDMDKGELQKRQDMRKSVIG